MNVLYIIYYILYIIYCYFWWFENICYYWLSLSLYIYTIHFFYWVKCMLKKKYIPSAQYVQTCLQDRKPWRSWWKEQRRQDEELLRATQAWRKFPSLVQLLFSSQTSSKYKNMESMVDRLYKTYKIWIRWSTMCQTFVHQLSPSVETLLRYGSWPRIF